jgi:propionyl-CoA synthetase
MPRAWPTRQPFWGEAAKDIDWITPPTRCWTTPTRRSTGGSRTATLNTCYNALDRHIAERGDQVAIHYDSPVTGRKASYTYAEVLGSGPPPRRRAGRRRGRSRATGSLVYMPMVPEAVFAMLACARIGAIHSVVFGGFAPAEVAARIDDAKPKLILTASCGIEPSRVVPYQPFLAEGIARSEHKPEQGRHLAAGAVRRQRGARRLGGLARVHRLAGR